MPSDPPRAFFCFSISFKFVLPKKYMCLKKMWKLCPAPPTFFKLLATPLCGRNYFFIFCSSLEFEWKIGHLRTCGPRLLNIFKCGPSCEHNYSSLIYIYPPIMRKQFSVITSSLTSSRSSVYHTKMGESRLVPFPTAQQVSLPACSPHCPFNAERQARKP